MINKNHLNNSITGNIIMKTLITLLATTLFTSVVITTTAQAQNPISSLTYEDSSNMFSSVDYTNSSHSKVLSFGDDHNKQSVWSTEYEQYVNPAEFTTEIASLDDVNRYMEVNPSAAQKTKGREVFIYNETAGEYHLQ